MKRFILFCMLIQNGIVFAQWSTDPNVNLQVSTWGQYPVACTDGEGGVYIRWEQNSYTTDQYIQHVNKYGYVRWATPVEVYGTQNGTVFEGKICPDDSNGVIVLFTEWNVNGGDPQYFTHKRVRVNRLDSNGNKLWGEYGVRVSMRDTSQALREIVTDGQKGCIVAFLVAPDSLYVQRISSTGQRMWGEEGVFITRINSSTILLSSNDVKGIIVHYYFGEARFCKIDSLGNTVWNISSSRYYSRMLNDNRGGVILSGYYSGFYHAIANYLSGTGNFGWGSDGIVLADSTNINYPAYILHQDSLIYFGWTEYKKLEFTNRFQKLNYNGQIYFNHGGKLVCMFSSTQSDIQLASSDSGNFFIFWNDERYDGDGIFAQKYDINGNSFFENDIPITNRDIRGFYQSIEISNQSTILLWDEAPLNGIYCQQIDKNGLLGNVISVKEKNNHNPTNFTLFQNYPNPFNNSTVIKYEMYHSQEIELVLYNILGQKVKSLYKGFQQSGLHSINLDMKNLSSGVYVYRLKSSSGTLSRKMIYIK